MKKELRIFIAVIAILLIGCSRANEVKQEERRIFYVLTASFYGKQFHGRRTASGDIFDMHKRTAAHRTWPLGNRRRLFLVNPKNNKSTVVVLNDRGPYDPRFLKGEDRRLVPHPQRQLDISYQAAVDLGMINEGVAELLVEIVPISRPVK